MTGSSHFLVKHCFTVPNEPPIVSCNIKRFKGVLLKNESSKLLPCLNAQDIHTEHCSAAQPRETHLQCCVLWWALQY